MLMNLISVVKSSINDIPNQKYRIENSFYLKEEGIHHFFCVCGHHDVVADVKIENPYVDKLKFNRDEIEFTKLPDVFHPDNCCLVCGNERYLDMRSLLFEDRTRFWTDVNWAYEVRSECNSWSVIAFVSIPKFDYDTYKIVIKKLELSRYVVGHGGESFYNESLDFFFKKQLLLDGKYYRVKYILKNKINDKISDFMIENPSESLAWLKGEERDLENLCFFLKNSEIRFKDALYWKDRELFLYALNKYQYLESSLNYILNHRKEKSLRKAQFKSYQKMMLLGGYSPMADYIFSQTIDDVNHLVKVLNMDVAIKIKLFDDCTFENLNHFIGFLKRHYQEKYIVRFWLSITHDDLNHFLLRDTTTLFYNKRIREELERAFQKTPLNIRAIHHELTKHSRALKRLNGENRVLDYADFLHDSEMLKENILYALPYDSGMLYKWGELLYNCLSTYFNRITMGKSTVFGLFIGGKLTYAIDIYNHEIVQASSSYNQPVPKCDREKIERWHKDVYMSNYMKNFT